MKILFFILQIIISVAFVIAENLSKEFFCDFGTVSPYKLFCKPYEPIFINDYSLLTNIYDIIKINSVNLIIEDCAMHYLPKNIGIIFSKVLYFYVYRTGLKEITKDILKEFVYLQYITLTSNDLTFIPSDLFSENSYIKYVDLSYNKILWINIDKQIFIKIEEVYIDKSANELFVEIKKHINEELKDYYNKLKLNEVAKISDVIPKFQTVNKALQTLKDVQSMNFELLTKKIESLNVHKIKNDLGKVKNSSDLEKELQNSQHFYINESISQIKEDLFSLGHRIKVIEKKNDEEIICTTGISNAEKVITDKSDIFIFILIGLNVLLMTLVIGLIYKMNNQNSKKQIQQNPIVEMQTFQSLYPDPNYDELVPCSSNIELKRNHNNVDEAYGTIWDSQLNNPNETNDVYATVDLSKKTSRRIN